MNAIEVIKDLRKQNFTVKADGGFLELSPPEKITDELIQRLRKHKPAILAELRREERRKKVAAMLADKPETKRAIITDNVILTIAIRDVVTFEMLISREKYDPFLLLDLLRSQETVEH